MMMQLFRAGWILLGSAGAALAQQPQAESPAQPERSLVWRVQGEAGTVLLAGTVHLLREEDLPYPPGYDAAYETADEVVFEIDMDEAATPEAQRKIVEIGRLPGDESLSDHLAAGTLVRLRDYLDSLGRPRRSFDRFKPGMIVFMIGSIEAMRLGARVEHGLEEHFHRRCMEDGKPTRALETLEYQLTLFDALPPEELDRMLLDALAEAGKNGESFVRLIGAWKSGDADRLGRLMDREMPLDSPQRDILLGRRNANWIPEIEAALEEEGTTLFLVGAAHLVGEDSVVSLLRKRGWQLERVTSSDPARKTRTQDMQAPAPAP